MLNADSLGSFIVMVIRSEIPIFPQAHQVILIQLGLKSLTSKAPSSLPLTTALQSSTFISLLVGFS